jgi:signal transduction histidine kinase
MKRYIKSLTLILLIFLMRTGAGYTQNSRVTDSLLQVIATTTSDSLKARLSMELSGHFASTDYKLAYQYAQEALERAKKTDSTPLIADATSNAAWVCIRLGVMDLAVRYFTDHLEIIEKSGTKLEMAQAMFNLGMVRTSLKEYEIGEELQVKALEFLNSNQDELKDTTVIIGMRIMLHNNLGFLYRETGALEKSAENIQKGIIMARAFDDNDQPLAMLLNNHGETQIQLGDYDGAELSIREALAITRKNGDIPRQSNLLLTLGKVYQGKSQNQSALSNFSESYRLAVQVNGFTLIQSAAEQLYKLYEKTGPADSTLKYLTVFRQYEEKINQDKAREELIRQELTDRIKKNEEERIASEKRSRTKSVLILIAVISAGLVISGMLVYFKKYHRKNSAENRKILELVEALKKENVNKDKLFAIIAHDLRGPVGNLKAGLEMITSGEPLDENIKNRILNELKKGSGQTFGLLENMLLWTKLQGNSIALNPAKVDLETTVRENIELVTPMARQKEIRIAIKSEKSIHAFADKESVNLIFRNLLSNAIKFTPNKGLIVINIREAADSVEVKVEDNGVGMTRETAENLFKSNNNQTTYGTNGEKGTGLGLGLVREFVERNGGTIRVESEPGKGSTFIFTLPEAT